VTEESGRYGGLEFKLAFVGRFEGGDECGKEEEDMEEEEEEEG